MPDVSVNKELWDGTYHWDDGGDEWSHAWGGPSMQWHGAILPRIRNFVPTGKVLEIACGYGRWTQFLKDLCDELVLVELSEQCIRECKKRFSSSSHISYHLNDGKSLDMVENKSIDFIFSFDSLVHVDVSVLDAYFKEMSRILSADGTAFIHHSNLGEYSKYYGKIRSVPKLWGILKRIGVVDRSLHKRDWIVSAEIVSALAHKYDLKCISQEIVRWGTKRAYNDCFSVIVRKESPRAQQGFRTKRNREFMEEVTYLNKLSHLYPGDTKSFENS